MQLDGNNYEDSARHEKKSHWQEVSSNFNVRFIVGNEFGMLNMKAYCSCCDYTTVRDFFFVNTEQDHVFKMMSPLFDEKCLQIYLPNGDQGFFDLVTTNEAFSDEYVLQLLVDYNSTDTVSTQLTVNHLFDTLAQRIKMRTMFKKLYFRCFRYAFRPNENQARLACDQWATIKIN